MKFDRIKLLMNRHMASHGFDHGSVGRGLGHGSVGHGTEHQDYPLPEAHPPGIMFSRVSRTRPTRCPQATIPAPEIVRSFFSY
jgi:hypothetical protein